MAGRILRVCLVSQLSCGLCRLLVRSGRPLFIALCSLFILAGCDLRSSGSGFWRDESTKLSPRVVELGQPVPKGGGRYKIGSPYRINGKIYTPREVDRHNEQGMASWYGELFHGRRTANGEIYNMEALTAAHPTLPLPSYARVTNLRNGRSLVVRINDRGPYARDRVIDLSWAVASLLQMRASGTAPVRVEYLGLAPLSGDDSYERSVLARQSWAGPRVAYSSSPGKAIQLQRTAAATGTYSVARDQKTASVAALSATKATVGPSGLPLTPPPHAARAIPSGVKAIALSQVTPKDRIEKQPLANTALQRNMRAHKNDTEPSVKTASAQARPADRHNNSQATQAPSGVFVEAGVFRKKPLADELAQILSEIAPASVEPTTIGELPVHRVRLGPFPNTQAAHTAAERVRKAGLKGAYVEVAAKS